jgi:hypothetical protein
MTKDELIKRLCVFTGDTEIKLCVNSGIEELQEISLHVDEYAEGGRLQVYILLTGTTE